jgi:uncharacterized NAD-dependent epimerase/dehydratase family protein
VKKVRIVVIDSGISPLSKVSNCVVDSYALSAKNCQWVIHKAAIADSIGHGTAVANIIWTTNNNIEIIIFRIHDFTDDVDEVGMVRMLEYIYENIDVDIINISAGLTYIFNLEALRSICDRLSGRGITIVAAFDNEGAVSFPAALTSVISVDVDQKNSSRNDITLIENSIINVLVSDRYYRTEWLSEKTIIKGTSFACAYISGLLSLHINSISNASEILHKIATKTETYNKHESVTKLGFNIDNAIIFPINKESHAILRLKDKLRFKIIGAYDDRFSGKIGKELFGEEIKSYEDINWNACFDTVILSCVSELCKLTKRNYIENVINNAKKHNKQIYTFECLPDFSDNIFYPQIARRNVPIENNSKLYKATIPVVCVVGTSSKQGKFTLQQKIITSLVNSWFRVGSISTEPSGYLFGADYVFHFGYKADLDLNSYELIAIINEMIFNVQSNDRDVLITGCQSGTIHYGNSNINDFAIAQYSFLLGTLPDMFVLCVNPHDSVDYIRRTINFLNAIDVGKVRALVIYPMKAVETITGIGYKIDKISQAELVVIIQKLKDEFDLPVFSMDDSDVLKICSLIIDEFSNENGGG